MRKWTLTHYQPSIPALSVVKSRSLTPAGASTPSPSPFPLAPPQSQTPEEANTPKEREDALPWGVASGAVSLTHSSLMAIAQALREQKLSVRKAIFANRLPEPLLSLFACESVDTLFKALEDKGEAIPEYCKQALTTQRDWLRGTATKDERTRVCVEIWESNNNRNQCYLTRAAAWLVVESTEWLELQELTWFTIKNANLASQRTPHLTASWQEALLAQLIESYLFHLV